MLKTFIVRDCRSNRDMTRSISLLRRATAAFRLSALLIWFLANPASAADVSKIELRLPDGETGVDFQVPTHCALRYGPGTAEAVCDPDGSPEASRTASVAASLYFEVTLEASRDGGLYAFADFQKELPGLVCGEERVSRLRIDSPQRQVTDGRIVYSAMVTCPAIRFIGLGPRRAMVRYIFGEGLRVNVMARVLSDDFDRSRPTIDEFLGSVTLHTEKKQ